MKIAFILITSLIFIGLYILVCLKIFYGNSQGIIYIQDEVSFGSVTFLGVFISMTIMLWIVCNYLIDAYTKRKKP